MAERAIQDSFLLRMRSKGHAANIEFLHEKEMDSGEIVLKVIPDAVQTGKGDRSVVEHGLEVSALSGGEKSLTSLVLLSAIARVSGPPFRVIDEFDVFQDEATRKKSISYLLECVRCAARARPPHLATCTVRALTPSPPPIPRPPLSTPGTRTTLAPMAR
jgi:hypothetical protein